MNPRFHFRYVSALALLLLGGCAGGLNFSASPKLDVQSPLLGDNKSQATPDPSLRVAQADSPSARAAAAASNTEEVSATASQSIMDYLSKSERYSVVVALLKAAKMTDMMDGPGPLTFYAPTNAAFDTLPPNSVEWLLKNNPERRKLISKLLKYHIHPGVMTLKDMNELCFKGGGQTNITTLEGHPLFGSLGQLDIPIVGSAYATELRIAPPLVMNNGVLYTTNSIFRTDELHQAIDNRPEEGPGHPSLQGMKSTDNLMSNLEASSDFSTLVTALKDTGMAESLRLAGPITLFAPTNGAFNKLPADKRAGLNKRENREEAIELLKTNIVMGRVGLEEMEASARKYKGKAKLQTLEGSVLTATQDASGTWTVSGPNGATFRVSSTNLKPQSNGLLYAVDTVMVP